MIVIPCSFLTVYLKSYFRTQRMYVSCIIIARIICFFRAFDAQPSQQPHFLQQALLHAHFSS